MYKNSFFSLEVSPKGELLYSLQDGKKTYHLIVTFDTAAFNELSTEAGEQQSR